MVYVFSFVKGYAYHFQLDVKNEELKETELVIHNKCVFREFVSKRDQPDIWFQDAMFGSTRLNGTPATNLLINSTKGYLVSSSPELSNSEI